MSDVHVILKGQPITDPKNIVLWPSTEEKDMWFPAGEYTVAAYTYDYGEILSFKVTGTSDRVTNVSHTFCPSKGFKLFLENQCPAGTTTGWHVQVVDVDRNTIGFFDGRNDQSEMYVRLEAGKYLISDWTEDGSFRRGPVEVIGSADGGYTYTMRLCEATPTPTVTATLTSTSAPTQDLTFLLPRKYYFGNNCAGEPFGRAKDGVYWVFTMLESFTGDTGSVGKTIEVFIPLGESRSGELSAGRYHIRSWIVGDEGSTLDYEDNISGDQGAIVVNTCPDMPLLPDAP